MLRFTLMAECTRVVKVALKLALRKKFRIFCIFFRGRLLVIVPFE